MRQTASSKCVIRLAKQNETKSVLYNIQANVARYLFRLLFGVTSIIICTTTRHRKDGSLRMTFEQLMNAWRFSKAFGNKNVYKALLEQMRRDRITPVIGAGISCWAGYPLWGKLLAEQSMGTSIESAVEEELRNEHYEHAASMLESLFRPNGFLRILRDEFSPEKLQEEFRPSYQRLLPSLFPGPVVTTNFDISLERLLSAPFTITPESDFTAPELEERIHLHRRLLIKLHGSVEDPAHMILTEKRYNEVYGNDPQNPDLDLALPATLKRVFNASPPLFLGCSLGSDRTCAVLSACRGASGFALLERPETDTEFNTRLDKMDALNLQVIWYPHGEHDAVRVLIEQLARDLGRATLEPTGRRKTQELLQYASAPNFLGRDAEVWESFSRLDRVRLFISTLGREVRPEEQNALRVLTAEMDGHPMSIVHTATFGQDCPSLENLLRIWHTVEQNIPGEPTRRKSLKKSLALAWNGVGQNRAAIFRWALHANSLTPLDQQTLEELRDKLPEAFTARDWDDGARCLRQWSLIDGNAEERMLTAVKKIFSALEGASDFDRSALAAWTAWCKELMKAGLDSTHKDYSSRHERTITWLSQCTFLIKRCVDTKEYGLLEQLLLYADNYFQYDITRSLPLLEKLSSEIPEDFPQRSKIYKSLGDLYYRSGKEEEAKTVWGEAVRIDLNEQVLSHANELLSRSKILHRAGKLEEALLAVSEAKQIYFAEGDDLGRANVMQVQGNYLLAQKNWADACQCYERAKALYHQAEEANGLCDTLFKLLICKYKLEKEDEVRKYLLELAELLPNQVDAV